METVVVVTSEIGRPNPAIRALKAAGFRVTLRDLAGPLADVVLDGPDVIVIEVEAARPFSSVLTEVATIPDHGEVPIVAILEPGHLPALGKTTAVADFCLAPMRDVELVARVRRLIRAAHRGEDDKIRIGGLTVDLRGYEAAVDGAPVDLTYQEFQLLAFLASNPGQAFSRDQLLARVWGYDYYGGSRTVDIHVRRIRAKLGPRYAGFVKTIRHVGYKWAIPAELGGPEDDADE